MKLKMALAAVALIAVSAWAGKQTIPSFTIDGTVLTPYGTKLISDFDGDACNDILVTGNSSSSGKYGWAVYSWKKATYILISDILSSNAYVASNINYEAGILVDKDTYYTYDDGTTAASPNP